MSRDVTSLPDSSRPVDPHERPESLLEPDADAEADTGEAAGPRGDGHDPSIRGQRQVRYRAPTRGDPADLAAAAARLLRQARPLRE
jgi:hypothetical protein